MFDLNVSFTTVDLDLLVCANDNLAHVYSVPTHL